MVEFEDRVEDAVEQFPVWENPLREAHQRETFGDELGVARCPCCEAPLHLRCHGQGPHFECACERRPKAA